MNAHTYSSEFFQYIDAGSSVSASVVSRILLDGMRVDSLLDVGGGHGAWAREWLAAGTPDVLCIDGNYVSLGQLAIPADSFRAFDLSQPFNLDRRFDLVESLEVAEHIPATSAEIFVDNLVAHGDVILFSAAVPNQGGEHHVNEQLPEYWRAMFRRRGYAAYDGLRPILALHPEVKPWYRFNSFIYANEEGSRRLSPTMRDARVPDDVELSVGGNLSWMLRRAAVGFLPDKLVKPLAMLKASTETRLKSPWPQLSHRH